MSSKRVPFTISDAALCRRLVNPFVGLDGSALRTYRGELQALARAAELEQQRLASLLVLVSQAINIEEQDKSHRLYVSDHAVLRWLERHAGVSMADAREAVLAMVERDAPEVAVRDGVVVTVLPVGCEASDSLYDEAGRTVR